MHSRVLESTYGDSKDDAFLIRPDMTADEKSTRGVGDTSPWVVEWISVYAGVNGTFRTRDGDHELGFVKVWATGIGMELEIFVAPEYRHHGFGRQILEATIATCHTRWPSAPLVAKVKRDNIASRRLFAAAGYRLTKEIDNTLLFDGTLVFVRPPRHKIVQSD